MDQQSGSDVNTVDHLPKFRYGRLRKPHEQIRLLRRHPRQGWVLESRNFAKIPTYAALSYTWGDEKVTKNIVLHRRKLCVTHNCWYALQQLHALTEHKYFWIDAICINQQDEAEKGSQVQIMRRIYGEAACTFVGLGPHDEHSRRVFDAVQEKTKHQVRPGSPNLHNEGFWSTDLDDETCNELIVSLLEFDKRPYWRRLWILQEAVLSEDLRIMCDLDVILWNHLVDLVTDLKMRPFAGESVVARVLKLKKFQGRSTFIGTGNTTAEDGHTKSTLEAGLDTIRLFAIEKRRTRTREIVVDLMDTLLESCELKCSKLHDRIYGVTALVKLPPNNPIAVSYNLSVFDLAHAAMEHYPVTRSFADGGPWFSYAVIVALALELHTQVFRDTNLAQLPIENADFPMDEIMTGPGDRERIVASSAFHLKPENFGSNIYIDIGNLEVKVASEIVIKEDAIGAVGPQCHEGDVLLEFIDLRNPRALLHLVARHLTEEICKIVGIAIIEPNTLPKPPQHPDDGPEVAHTVYEAYFDTRDLLHPVSWAVLGDGPSILGSLARALRFGTTPIRSASSSYIMRVKACEYDPELGVGRR